MTEAQLRAAWLSPVPKPTLYDIIAAEMPDIRNMEKQEVVRRVLLLASQKAPGYYA